MVLVTEVPMLEPMMMYTASFVGRTKICFKKIVFLAKRIVHAHGHQELGRA